MTTVPDLLRHMGGAPVGSGGPYYSFWNDNVYFVDYDNGSTGSTGKEVTDPGKHLATVISAADKWDTIYIRPRDPAYTTGDSNYITPASATNWTIPATKYGMSLVGTGLGRDGHGMAYQTYLRGHGSVTTGSVLTVSAPFVVLENLAFHRGGGTTTGIVLLDGGTYGTATSFAGSVTNCLFRFGNGTGVQNAALNINDHWYAQIYDSTFYRNAIGIGMYAVNSTTRAVDIQGNTFEGVAGDIRAHIAANGTAAYIKIAHNYFLDDKPSVGYAKYIDMSASGGATSTGGIFDNYFGTASTTTTTIITANGLKEAGNYAEGQLIT